MAVIMEMLISVAAAVLLVVFTVVSAVYLALVGMQRREMSDALITVLSVFVCLAVIGGYAWALVEIAFR